jgi:hypothetical protein
MVKSPKRHRRIVRLLAIFMVGMTLVLGCGRSPKPHPTCDAAEVPPDPATSAPRPDIAQASFGFHGNNPEQREFVFLHDDGSYDSVERWDMGVPVDEDLQFPMGWDWKVDCRMHQCALPDGTVCCLPQCGSVSAPSSSRVVLGRIEEARFGVDEFRHDLLGHSLPGFVSNDGDAFGDAVILAHE